MAGHSHWAGIKHHKAAADAKKGKIFSKHGKAIVIAARSGGGDPDMNLKLKYAVDRARADNMPKDVIERAIKKGTGETEGVSFAELTYEGFAPEKVAVVFDVLTDNRNRTAAELRTLFEKAGGTLASPGAVGWMFETRGVLEIPDQRVSENELFEAAVAAGADDLKHEGTFYQVLCAPEAFSAVRKALMDRSIVPETAEIVRHPSQTVAIATLESAERVMRFLTDLEDHEDVQRLYANYDIPAEILDKL